MTDHLVSYLRDALADSADGCVTFQHLSDEETAVIESDQPAEYAVQPWIESQKHLDAASASLFGRRSLYLRGLLTIEHDPRTGEPSLNQTTELRFVADARRLGVAYVLARATQHGERTARHNVLQSQIGSFEEDIDTDGFHHFSACTYRVALRRLAEWSLPSASDGDELRTSVSPRRWARWTVKELGIDVRTVEIDVFLPDGRGSFATNTLLTAHGNGAAVLAVAEGTSLSVATTNRSRLEQLLAERVSTALGVRI